MKTQSRSCDLQLPLDAANTELLRSFVREAALAEGSAASCAAAIAGDSAALWRSLCTNGSELERVHVSLSARSLQVTVALRLSGHSRFAGLLTILGSRMPQGAGFACRESGVDGWEITLHRSMVENREAQFAAAAEMPAPALAAVGDDVTIGLAQKSDAPAIARCFLAVYGHHYVHADVFSPKRYWARVEAGELIPVVTRDASGEVIGHVALEREAGAVVAERGEAVVLPSYRGHHLLERMTDRLSEEAPKHGLHGIYAEPLTIHTFSQRNDVRAGMPVCAVLLGANPESFRPRDIACPTAGQRQSYLRTFRFVQDAAPRSIPAGPYRDMLAKIYDSLGVKASDAAPSTPALEQSVTRISVNDRGYGVIRFERIGSNCAIELSQALRDVTSLGARSMQLSARMGDPGLAQLTDTARSLGFFFCGLGPCFADGEDLFLLQYLTEPLDTAKLQLLTDETRELVAFVEQDRGRNRG